MRGSLFQIKIFTELGRYQARKGGTALAVRKSIPTTM
jgi:hypothetical protein